MLEGMKTRENEKGSRNRIKFTLIRTAKDDSEFKSLRALINMELVQVAVKNESVLNKAFVFKVFMVWNMIIYRTENKQKRQSKETLSMNLKAVIFFSKYIHIKKFNSYFIYIYIILYPAFSYKLPMLQKMLCNS